jgi:small-conductance mechanosensitive channel
MADRLLVAYKTPLQRIIETALVLAAAFGAAALWQRLLPGTSTSYIIVASLFLGFAILPRLGSRWAARRGAVMMTAEERNRRYLSEMGPIGMGTVALARSSGSSGRRRVRSRPD